MVEILEILKIWSPVCYGLLLPGALIWLLTRALPYYLTRPSRLFLWSTRMLLWTVYAYVLFLSCGIPVLAAVAYVAATGVGQGETLMTVDGRAFINQTAGLLPYAPGSDPAPLNAMHSRGGEWAGRDYTRPCGSPIYAPFDGLVQRGGAGSKDSWGNTYIYIRSADGRYDMLIMHSDFSLSAGDSFRAGQQIGSTNTIGYSSECHEHISLLVDGVEVDPEQYRGAGGGTAVAAAAVPYVDLAGLMQALAALSYSPSSDVGLRISHYEPAAGGINCDHDCGHMASGDVTWDWTGGKNGIYAAACPPAWPFGTRFQLAGVTYECRDRGGWIQCYAPGETDKATGSAATESYCWVDLYNTPPVGYGTLVYDWKFVN
ncbi:MAG: M23 family metallopeptidase [Ardenticatenaceae bacterium]|nr:M23 family metallopeptidase [Ardenticatenaceae bacterium]